MRRLGTLRLNPFDSLRRPAPEPPAASAEVRLASAIMLGASDPPPGSRLAHFVWRRRFLRAPQLQAIDVERRLKDTSTVILFELDSYGDIGSTPLFPTPLSPLALTLLPVGGAACLLFGARPALQDVASGLRNLRALRDEKKRLLLRQHAVRAGVRARQAGASGPQATRNTPMLDLRRELMTLNTRLAICSAEQHSERTDRVISGALVAPGTIITAVGNFVTPGFLVAASNSGAALTADLLTGFVGNAPIALYSVVNAAYNARKARIAHRRLHHLQRFCLHEIWHDLHIDVDAMLQRRQQMIRNNAICKSISAIGIGVGGVLTAINPIGYAVLLPFAVGRATCEYLAHKKLGYSRRIYTGPSEPHSIATLVNEFLYTSKVYFLLKEQKRCTRQRYPWGMRSPMPCNWFVAAAGLGRHLWNKAPPPSHSLHNVMRLYQDIEAERIARWIETVVAHRQQLLRQPIGIGCDNGHENLHRLSAAVTRMRRRRERVLELGQLLAKRVPNSTRAAHVHDWLVVVVDFFVEIHLFPLLAKELYEDPCIRPFLRRTLSGDGRCANNRFCIDSRSFLISLRSEQAALLSNSHFLQSFYLCAERVLFEEIKQHFQELRRELMDIITTWLEQKNDPDAAPVVAVP